MRVGIVGSRKYRNKKRVESLIDTFIKKHGSTLVVVSGGCKSPKDDNGVPQNVDVWAERYAINQGIPVDIFLPDLSKAKGHWAKIVECYYKRNEKIVKRSDIIFAFFKDEPCSGGAFNTVKWARKYKKPLVLIFASGKVIKERC